VIEKLADTPNPVYILGDLNFPSIDWSFPTSHGPCAGSFLHTCAELNLTQLVNENTRGSNILDLLLTNNPQSVLDVNVCAPFSSSCDHSSVTANITIPRPQFHDNIASRDFYNGNYPELRTYLSTINWYHAIDIPSNNVLVMWENFVKILQFCVSSFVPLRKSKRPRKLPALIAKLLAKKRTAYKTSKAAYKAAALKYDQAVLKYHEEIESKLVQANDKSRFFSYVNKKVSTKPCIPPVQCGSGPLLYTSADKCAAFNEFFASTFTTDDGTLPDFSDYSKSSMMPPVMFSASEVHAALRALPPKYTSTPDGFPPILYHTAADILSYPLSIIFEQSMSSGIIPPIWKKAIVRPIHKKNSRHAIENYRPISLTSIACKTMERIVSKQMLSYLTTHDLISPNQYGFLPRRSTGSQLLLCLHKWISAIVHKSEVDVIFIDFAKAFDSVSHEKLLLKLDHYGFKYEIHSWISSFLSTRSQSVCIDEIFSPSLPVISGVPQGSVIGPLLFLIYINDIVSCVSLPAEIKLFADDSKLFLPITESNDMSPLTKSLANVVHWCEKWQIRIAIPKCSILTLSSKPDPSHRVYSIDGIELPHNTDVRDLGLMLSASCKQSLHCESICLRAKSRACCVLKSFVSNDKDLLVAAYKTYVRPICESDTPVWSPHLAKDIKMVEKVQKFFTRSLYRRWKLQKPCYLNRLRSLHIHSLEYRRLFFDLVMCFKIVHGLLDLSFSDFFEFDRSPYSLRSHSLKLKKSGAKLDLDKFSFALRITTPWNALPDKAVCKKSVSTFKAALDEVDLTSACVYFPA
jgi:hypothetical protein